MNIGEKKGQVEIVIDYWYCGIY